MSIIDAALSRSRTVIAVLALLLIAGFSSYVNIPKEARPDVNVPIIYVSMSLKGISPEDAERLLVRPLTALSRTFAKKSISRRPTCPIRRMSHRSMKSISACFRSLSSPSAAKCRNVRC